VSIVIQSSKEGFRRCGVSHSKSPVIHPDGRFTEKELKRLINEPKLSVTIIPDDAPAPSAKPEEEVNGIPDTDVVVGGGGTVDLDPETKAPAFSGPAQGEGNEVAPDVLEAARQAVAAGQTITTGAPIVKAMEEILGRDVDAAERDRAWDLISQGAQE
jgi:hypothetical protein